METASFNHDLVASLASSSSLGMVKSKPHPITADEAIDKIGMGPFQTRVLYAAGLCFIADAMEIMLLSFLSILLEDQWNLTGAESATITSSVFAGALVGTLILGPMGDSIGRRPTFLMSSLIITVFGFSTALANSYVTLLITRILVGFGVGGITVPFDILAEFLPTSCRGTYLILIKYFWSAGCALVPVIAYLTIGKGLSWKIFVILCAVPCFLSMIIGLIYVPESPRWLLSKGRKKEALEILRRAAFVNGKDPDVVFPPTTEFNDEEVEDACFSDLLSEKWRKVTIPFWGVWWGWSCGYYGTIIAITRVFDSTEEGSTDTVFDYKAIFISSIADFLGNFIAIYFVKRVGRIPLQVGAFCLGGIAFFFLCILAGIAGRWTLVSIAFSGRVFEKIGVTVAWVSAPEILSTEIRSTGHSAANAVARMGGFLIPYLIVDDIPLIAVGVGMLFIHILTIYCVSLLPETRGKGLGHMPERIIKKEDVDFLPYLCVGTACVGTEIPLRTLKRNSTRSHFRAAR